MAVDLPTDRIYCSASAHVDIVIIGVEISGGAGGRGSVNGSSAAFPNMVIHA